MNSLFRNAFLPVMALAVASVTNAAGEHGGHHGGESTGKPGSAENVSRSIDVKMMDNYYEPESIAVNPGETIRFRVKNEGDLVHEFNIGTAEMHKAHQREMQMMVQHGVIKGGKIDKEMMDMDMDMGNGHSMKHDDPNSVLMEPGETMDIIWTFSEAADLEFACNVPGHYQAGMHGNIEFN